MRQITDKEAAQYGIRTVHHEMENGEMRFRMISETGSSYILTKSTVNNGWQKSHVHHSMRELYLVEKGVAYIAMLIENKVEIRKLCENDSFVIPINVAHNVLMCNHAILHTIKYGTQQEDWTSCAELDILLTDYTPDRLFCCDSF